MAIKELLKSDCNVQLVINAADLREFSMGLINDTRELIKQEKNAEDERYLSVDEAAKELGVTRSTLWRWEKQEYLLPVKFGCKVRYKESDIKEIQEGKR